MLIFTITVLTIWSFTWLMWFFCVPGSKWLDDCLNDWNDQGILPIIGVALAALSLGGQILIKYFPPGDALPFGLCVIAAVISTGIWIGVYCYYALAKIHRELRIKRNY